MVKLTLSFVMLGLGLATAASAAPVDEFTEPTAGKGYQNPYKNSGTIGDANLDARLAQVEDEWVLRDAIYDWSLQRFGPLFEHELGVCEENSEKCSQAEMICYLGTPDCRRTKPGKERDELIAYYAGSYLTLFTHGKCHHNSENKEWCSKLGFCSKYHVKDDGKCKNLDLTEESNDVRKVLEHLDSSKGDAYAVQYDVPVGGYTWAERKKTEKN